MPLGKKIERRARRLVPSLLSPFLSRGRPDTSVPSLEALRRILLIRPEKLGDVMVGLPVAETLSRLAPQVEIDVVVSRYSYPLVAHDNRFSKVFVYRKRLERDIGMIRRARSRRYDCVFDMIDGDSVTGLCLAQFCAGRAVRIGGNKHRFADYYDFACELPSSHSIDRGLSLLSPLGIDDGGLIRYVPPDVPGSSERKAAAFLDGLRQVDTDSRIVAYNISAGKTTRLWPLEKSKALIERTLDAFNDAQVLIVVAPNDRERGVRLREQFYERVALLPDGWSILDVSAVLRSVDLLITPDTSLVHIARSYRTPVVGLYPRPAWNLERWRPYGQERGVVVSDDDGHIFGIEPIEVVNEARLALSGEGVTRP